MAALSRKVQILLDDRQHQMLLALAKARGKTVSRLLREAVVERLLRKARRAGRRRAFDEISTMALPVGDWEDMEKEIARVHARDRRRP